MSQYPDVAVSGLNPLVHYLRHGRAEGRTIEAAANSRGSHPVQETPSRARSSTVATPRDADRLETRIATLETRLERQTERIDWALGAVEGILPLIDEYHAYRQTDEYLGAFEASDPLVSVCIATVDRPALLVDRAVASVIAQSYRNLQIIIVADHTIDETEQRVSEIRDPRIQFVNLPERGPHPRPGIDRWYSGGSSTMNQALARCEGAFVTHLDDDDAMMPHRIETLLDAAREDRSDFVFHAFLQERANGSWDRVGNGRLEHGQVTTGSIFYQRFFTRIRSDPFAFRMAEPGDWNRMRKIKMLRPRLKFVAEPLFYHHLERARSDLILHDERFRE